MVLYHRWFKQWQCCTIWWFKQWWCCAIDDSNNDGAVPSMIQTNDGAVPSMIQTMMVLYHRWFKQWRCCTIDDSNNDGAVPSMIQIMMVLYHRWFKQWWCCTIDDSKQWWCCTIDDSNSDGAVPSMIQTMTVLYHDWTDVRACIPVKLLIYQLQGCHGSTGSVPEMSITGSLLDQLHCNGGARQMQKNDNSVLGNAVDLIMVHVRFDAFLRPAGVVRALYCLHDLSPSAPNRFRFRFASSTDCCVNIVPACCLYGCCIRVWKKNQ